ncbi:MarP family serine protease [Nocardioidaceae bacterium]|nr:MarP family serine protease [Nocardioidaceae bacterium]
MNLLDWVLVVLVLAYALSGYWQGFVTGAFATVGLLVGGAAGVAVAPIALEGFDPSLTVSLGALLIVLLAATIGQVIFQGVGARIRRTLTWQPARVLDAVGGAALSSVAVLVVAWALGVAVAGAKIPAVSEEVRTSSVLSAVDEVVPTPVDQALRRFNDTVASSSFFPSYLEPFANERIVDVRRPPARIAGDPQVASAEASVLKIRANNSCGRGVEGSGFLYNPTRLMTNAHVVAGVEEPFLIVDGEQVPARVVFYDPQVDVAVLAVDGLDRPFLSFDRSARDGQAGAVLGYPEDGPYDVQPARIRSNQQLRSSDIYGEGTVTRDVYAVRGLVRPGNSGGPMIDRQGEVVGVVFAASVTDEQTGYVLTADQVSRAAARGINRSRTVDTGDCA